MSVLDVPSADPGLLMRRIHELDCVRLRSELLGRKDRTLVQMIFDKGSTFEQLARLTGQSPSTVSRRFHTLLQKLITRELAWLLRCRKDIDESAVGMLQEYYLRGSSQRAIARKFDVSVYRVGVILRTVRAIAYNQSASPAEHNQPFIPTHRDVKGASHVHLKD